MGFWLFSGGFNGSNESQEEFGQPLGRLLDFRGGNGVPQGSTRLRAVQGGASKEPFGPLDPPENSPKPARKLDKSMKIHRKPLKNRPKRLETPRKRGLEAGRGRLLAAHRAAGASRGGGAEGRGLGGAARALGA